ncbi:MAG: hypothetical protein U0169_07805 [Polyangiaceae bacterium]
MRPTTFLEVAIASERTIDVDHRRVSSGVEHRKAATADGAFSGVINVDVEDGDDVSSFEPSSPSSREGFVTKETTETTEIEGTGRHAARDRQPDDPSDVERGVRH